MIIIVMEEKIGLTELSFYLPETYLRLKTIFLNDLLKDASGSNFPYKDKNFVESIGCSINQTKKLSTTIYGWMKGYRVISLSRLIKINDLSKYSWKDIEKNLISIKAGIRNGEIKPNFPIKLDKKLGSIVGHILGDGSIEKRFHALFFSNSDIDLLKEFSQNMEFIFGIKPRIWVQEKKLFHEGTKWLMKVDNLSKVPKGHCVGLFYPKICSDFLYAICGKFAEGKRKKITNQIKDMPKEFKIGLVRAFFDDEGSVRADNYILRLHQDNKKLLEGIKKFLKELGINSNPIRGYIKRDKIRYYFNITGFKEYYKFYNTLGCTSKKKCKEFELLINKVENSKYFKKKYAL